VLAVVNSGLLGTYAALLGGGVNGSLILFFGLLLTLVIVLYDRFIGDCRSKFDPPEPTPTEGV